MNDTLANPKPTLSPKTRPQFRTSYAQAKELQRLLMERATAGEEKALVLAGIARAFCELEETKRKLRMKPLPKAIDVSIDGKAKARAKSQAPPTFNEG